MYAHAALLHIVAITCIARTAHLTAWHGMPCLCLASQLIGSRDYPRLLSNTFLIWSPDSPRRVWGLDYSIVYSYLGICHVTVFGLRSSLQVTHSSSVNTLRPFQAPAPFPFPHSDSNFGALYCLVRQGARGADCWVRVC